MKFGTEHHEFSELTEYQKLVAWRQYNELIRTTVDAKIKTLNLKKLGEQRSLPPKHYTNETTSTIKKKRGIYKVERSPYVNAKT